MASSVTATVVTLLLLVVFVATAVHPVEARTRLSAANKVAHAHAHAHAHTHARAHTPLANTAALGIDYSTRPANESIDMWGIFFEEIGHTGVGGLYNQVLNNSNFEIINVQYAAPSSLNSIDPRPIETFYEPWFLLPSPAGQDAWISITTEYPLNGWNTHAISVRSVGSSAGTVTLVNPGFSGINTIGVSTYTVSFFAMGLPNYYAVPSQFTVSVYSNATGAAYTSTTVAVSLTSSWQKISLTLTMPANASFNDPAACFSISWPTSASGPTVVYFDVLTMYPNDGWNGLPYIRPDFAQLLADMHPSFVRFPGGCYVEGMVLGNRFNWKNTIGPVEQRRGHWGIWGYYSEDYLGIYEYFSFVEKLTDAYGNPTRAYWVINTGNSHFQQMPADQLGQYVQDALDSIEFILGPVTSHYGAIRAAMGHPEPFTSLTHVSIGNEGNLLQNWQNAYVPNYAVIYKALKAAYPQLTYIANDNLEPFNVPTEMWDYHVYESDTYFFNNSHYFDDASRTLPVVFNSEYAAVSSMGTAIGALSESAWLSGLQRNGDLVTAVSYGALPLCITFDNHRIYGTPSYWTQWLYGNANLGTVSGTVQTLEYVLQGGGGGGSVPSLFAVVTVATLNATVAKQKSATQVVMIKVINANASAVTMTIDLANVPSSATIQPVADVWTIAASSPSQGNSFQQPTAVAPVASTTTVPTGGSSWQYTFAPWSTTLVQVYVSA